MIQRLQPEDLLPYQVDLAEAYARFKQGTGQPDVAYFIEYWQSLYGLGIGQIFGDLHDGRLTASLGAVLTPDLYDQRPVAMELFWNKRPDAPMGWHRLFDVYETWAREHGAKAIYLTRWSENIKMGTFFNTVLGYRDSEASHRKDL